MMAKNPHQNWAESQIAALVEIGIDLQEAQRSVKWVLDNLPQGEDPATWIPSAEQINVEISDADIVDARADWYASDSVPPRFKRLLDAVEDVD
jgi:hypothetical protein